MAPQRVWLHRVEGMRRRSPPGRTRQASEVRGRELALPGLLAPSACLQPQAVATRGCIGNDGALLSLNGGSLFETSEGHQALRLGPRPRPLTCLSGSPCGHFWAIGESCSGGRGGQVLVLNGAKQLVTSLPLGVRRSCRHLCWACHSELIAAVVEFESDQPVPEQQIMVWSWPKGERLATASCDRGTQEPRAPEARSIRLFTYLVSNRISKIYLKIDGHNIAVHLTQDEACIYWHIS